MSVLRKNVEYAQSLARARLGNPYVYGGMWSQTNVKQGTDCSGLWNDLLGAATGKLKWGRESEGATTESYRPKSMGGPIPDGGVGPFGTINVSHPSKIPANAVAKLAFHHGPGGGANSHMWGELDGVRWESAGSKGHVTGSRAMAIDASYANAWAYLPGPILDQPGDDVPDNRPAFNEFPLWSPNHSDRRGVKIDAIFLHTSEGGGGNAAAEDLAKYFTSANRVSYHYTGSQASDGGVTVVDCVDTDQASWSVLSANPRSINYCFAGSRAAWTREEWIAKAGKVIDVFAYLIVQDCRKYGIPIKIVAPPYTDRIPGISDHHYVTKVLGDGTHTDVGPNFPWDRLKASVNKYANPTQEKPPVTQPTGPKPVGPADDQLTLRWNMLGGQTVVEALAEIRDKVLGTEDRGKAGAK